MFVIFVYFFNFVLSFCIEPADTDAAIGDRMLINQSNNQKISSATRYILMEKAKRYN